MIKFIQSTLNINSSTNKRKYNILLIISEYLEPDWLIKTYKVRFFSFRFLTKCFNYFKKNLISELFSYSGDQFTTSSVSLLESILQRLYDFEEKNIELWKRYWINEYIDALDKENRVVVKGIINNMNPILTKIDKNSIIILIREFEAKKKIGRKNFLWAYVSLIKLAREKSLIRFSEQDFFIEEIIIPKERIEVF